MAQPTPSADRYTTPISPQYSPSESARRPQGDQARSLPHDHAAEQALLGVMMLSAHVVDDVTDVIGGTDFYQPSHEAVFDAIVSLASTGRPSDPVAVADELSKRGALSAVGGASYLHDLFAAATIGSNAGHYAEIIKGHSVRRRIISAGVKATQLGFDAHGEAADIADQAQQAFYAATEDSRRETTPLAGALLGETYDWLESPERSVGIPTGFPDVDRLLSGGLEAGQMAIIAARPGMGKSTFAMDIARHAAIRRRIPTLFVSLEMSRHELMLRILSAHASIPLNSLRQRDLTSGQWDQLQQASTVIQDAPLWLEDRGGITPLELRAKARQLKRQGLGLIVLDYLQLMSSGRRVESRQVEVSEFSRQIKLLAKELEIPILTLSQLNRQSEQRADRKPAMADLRESGSLEQDADIVILLHREDATDKTSARLGEADIIVAKNRNGETGSAVLLFQGALSRFTSAARL